jgi:hypothetical protein
MVPLGWSDSVAISPGHTDDAAAVKSMHMVATFQTPTTDPPHAVKVPHDAEPTDESPQPKSETTTGATTRNNNLFIATPIFHISG